MIETGKLVRPNIVIFTNTGKSHLSYMHSQVRVADIKSELFMGLEPNGLAIINRDDKFFSRINEAAIEYGARQIITFGEHPESSVRLLEYAIDEESTSVVASIYGNVVRYKIYLQGHRWAITSLAVLATASLLGFDINEITKKLAYIKPVYRRGDKYIINLRGKKISLYNDSFNANPLSMKTAIDLLTSLPSSTKKFRRLLVLGDMLALGEYEVSEHLLLAKEINQSNIDLVFTCGSLMQYLFDSLDKKIKGFHRENSLQLANELINAIEDNDIIVVKGSRGMQMEIILNTLLEMEKKEVNNFI